MAAVTTDEQVLACVSQLAEFCEKLGVSAEASTCATPASVCEFAFGFFSFSPPPARG